MNSNLDTLKREILERLEAAGVAIFRSNPGGLENMPMVLWDTTRYPDFQMFLEVAMQAGVKLVMFAAAEFQAEDIDEVLEQLEACELTREEQREYESRLRKMRAFEGVTCSLEVAFDYQSRLYVFEVQPDWYDDFLNIEDEIGAHLADAAETGGDESSLGGYFSKN